jgi:hypothetical protein
MVRWPPSCLPSGTRWAIPWCGRACCSAPGIHPGWRADGLPRGSARGPGTHGAGYRRRSQIAFIRGAWTAVRTILVPAAWKAAPDEAVRFDPRSRTRNLMSSNRSPRVRARLRPAELSSPRSGSW